MKMSGSAKVAMSYLIDCLFLSYGGQDAQEGQDYHECEGVKAAGSLWKSVYFTIRFALSLETCYAFSY